MLNILENPVHRDGGRIYTQRRQHKLLVTTAVNTFSGDLMLYSLPYPALSKRHIDGTGAMYHHILLSYLLTAERYGQSDIVKPDLADIKDNYAHDMLVRCCIFYMTRRAGSHMQSGVWPLSPP